MSRRVLQYNPGFINAWSDYSRVNVRTFVDDLSRLEFDHSREDPATAGAQHFEQAGNLNRLDPGQDDPGIDVIDLAPAETFGHVWNRSDTVVDERDGWLTEHRLNEPVVDETGIDQRFMSASR